VSIKKVKFLSRNAKGGGGGDREKRREKKVVERKLRDTE